MICTYSVLLLKARACCLLSNVEQNVTPNIKTRFAAQWVPYRASLYPLLAHDDLDWRHSLMRRRIWLDPFLRS